MKRFKTITTIFFFVLFVIPSFSEASIEVKNSYSEKNSDYTVETQTVRFYAQAVNKSPDDVYGFVQFLSNDQPIEDPQPVSILKGETDSVFIDVLLAPGEHKISAGVFDINTKQIVGTPELIATIQVDRDFDGDKIGNLRDPDDDNDGLTDAEETTYGTSQFSKDTDGDKILDPDEIINGLNPNDPLDANDDPDGDGISNIEELKQGTDPFRNDSDQDGIDDKAESEQGTNPQLPDTDGDGLNDSEDVFPLDKNETKDSDNDGIGNTTDTDDDNDTLLDEYEISIETDPEKYDTDEDGISDKDEIEQGTDPLNKKPEILKVERQKEDEIHIDNHFVTIWPFLIIFLLIVITILIKKISKKEEIQKPKSNLKMKIEKNKPR